MSVPQRLRGFLADRPAAVVHAHDDRAFFPASPDELPVIDIHSL
jgi:hypothetical protein